MHPSKEARKPHLPTNSMPSLLLSLTFSYGDVELHLIASSHVVRTLFARVEFFPLRSSPIMSKSIKRFDVAVTQNLTSDGSRPRAM